MTMGGLALWLAVALSAGWLARMVLKGRSYYFIEDTIIGIAGSILGGTLLSLSGQGAPGLSSSIIVAFIGAISVILIGRALRGHSGV